MQKRFNSTKPYIIATRSGKKVADASTRVEATQLLSKGRNRVIMQATVSFNASGRLYTTEV